MGDILILDHTQLCCVTMNNYILKLTISTTSDLARGYADKMVEQALAFTRTGIPELEVFEVSKLYSQFDIDMDDHYVAYAKQFIDVYCHVPVDTLNRMKLTDQVLYEYIFDKERHHVGTIADTQDILYVCMNTIEQ